MNNRLKHLAELAIIRAIPDLVVSGINKGRMSGLFNRLQKAADLDLKKIRAPSKIELIKIWDVVETFRIKSGWDRGNRHTATIISFCLAVIENSDFKFNQRIIDTLQELILYFEDAQMLPGASAWAGLLAAKRWEDTFS